MKHFDSIYHLCLMLSNLIYTVVHHFPGRIKYTEGADLRKATVNLVTDCLFYIRANSKNERDAYSIQVGRDLTKIEALISILNNVKVCTKRRDKLQRWDKLISSLVEIRILDLIKNIRDCLR